MWERGLKDRVDITVHTDDISLPVWERGLKEEEHRLADRGDRIAPRVGAWIES